MRLTRKIAALTAGTALIAGSLLATAPAATATATGGSQVVDALVAGYGDGSNGDPYDVQILTSAVIATELVPTLRSLDGITILAPNDRAFEVLATKLGLLGKGYRYRATVDEDTIVAALLTLPNAAATIRSIVLYHVYPGGALPGSAVVRLPVFGTQLTMADGQKLTITNVSRLLRTPTVILGDKDGVWWNDSVVTSKVDDVAVPGAVVHGISDVLLPKL